MNVLVCDDLDNQNLELEESIESARQSDITTKRLYGSELKEQLSTLIDRADWALSGDTGPNNRSVTAFDKGFDLIILDNNLAHLGIRGARLTAESIAGYIRAFSSSSYIVSINKNPGVDFDLRYLVGDYATKTDLALNTRHLSNPALWTGKSSDARDGFLPWYWPTLRSSGSNRRKQIEFVKRHFNESVCDALGIATDDFRFLPRQARSLLSRAEETREIESSDDGLSGLSATFHDIFLVSGRSIPSKDERERIIAKSSGDDPTFKTAMAQVVAADIESWFRRDVLGPQETLVDIPHLLIRMPFLLGNRSENIACWNSVLDTDNEPPPYGLDPALFDDHLEGARFDQEVWAPRPCFWWSKLREDNILSGQFSADAMDWADAVFCEDRSEFLPLDMREGSFPPREFVAQFEGSWNRRYVAGIQGIRYVPKSRFAK